MDTLTKSRTALAEAHRLAQNAAGAQLWKRWGPYLAERQWGTVREDYSSHGTAWDAFPHDHARSRAYRWGEDGIGGWSDDQQLLCMSVALWNERDPILKERLFGLTNGEGNHGEDCKEQYYYLDAVPSHAWASMLYKYPQREYPYAELVAENRGRGRGEPEYELIDTGAFDEDCYFDVFVEYARTDVEDIYMRVRAINRGPVAAPLHLLPQVWFRNTWSWRVDAPRPRLEVVGARLVRLQHPDLGERFVHVDGAAGLLVTENETNVRRLFGSDARGPFKDAFHEHIVEARQGVLSIDGRGTKLGVHRRTLVQPGEEVRIQLRLCPQQHARPFAEAEAVFAARRHEADAFYEARQTSLDADARCVHRQACAGLLWSKQFYYYDVRDWLEGDPAQPAPPHERRSGRNRAWRHLNNADVISMPDKWEYPWYASWDLAFQCVPLAEIDPDFAKAQLMLLTREWYMHPSGQLPAYEWAFDDVNPPVHAWATWRVFEIDRALRGDAGDIAFLESVFHKLMLNFTWWVNRKDEEGNGIFSGGFLGLDNIGVFDRSAPLPTGGKLSQSDGTAWVAMFSLNLMRIALELATHNAVYEDVATKFFEHFLHIAEAMTDHDGRGMGLWDEADGFYYDALRLPDGRHVPMKLRSLVGLLPMCAVEVLEPELLARLPGFAQRLEWVLQHRPELARLVSRWQLPGQGERRLLSLLRGHRLKCLLQRMLDPREFLAPHGIRSISRHHLDEPYRLHVDGTTHEVHYEPAESRTSVFGGNSNWRGPIWFPVNFLIIEALRKLHRYYGEDFRVEHPVGSGSRAHLEEVADDLARRLGSIFLRDEHGRRPVFGTHDRLQSDPAFRDYLLFYEYFHGDDGRGVGASHQTGWTALVATLMSAVNGKEST